MGDLHVLIVGAGVTGLLIAQGLKKAGIQYTIFESEPYASYYRPREWSMSIHWALPLLEALLPSDLAARLKETQCDPFWEPPNQDVIKIYNGLDGSVMKELPVARMIRVSRRKLRAFCSQGINVKYGYDLTGVKYGEKGDGITATFANGEYAHGSLIIGSDGPRSKVRETLLGREKGDVTAMEVVHTNIAVVYHDAEKAKVVHSAHPVFSLMAHPSLISVIAVQDVPSETDPAGWRFQVVTSWLGKLDKSLDQKTRLVQVKEKASVLAEPFRSAVQWMPDDTKVDPNSIMYWVPVPWDNHEGRATLAGDAAHPMPPHRGQGLNNAVCDASNFVNAIQSVASGASNLKEAISAYSDEVVQRGGEEVLMSRQNALALHHWDQLTEGPVTKIKWAHTENQPDAALVAVK